MPAQRQRGSAVMLYMQAYHDQLLRDMGQQPYRKGRLLHPLRECFSYYSAADYHTLFQKELGLHTIGSRKSTTASGRWELGPGRGGGRGGTGMALLWPCWDRTPGRHPPL